MKRTFEHRQLRYRPVSALVLAALMMGLWAGCADAPSQSPQQVAQKFLTDLKERNHAQVMQAVWPPTRQQLQAPHESAVRRVDADLYTSRHEMLTATRVDSLFLIDRMDVEDGISEHPQDGEEIRLRLQFRDDRVATMTMRWGDGRWYVDLPVDESTELNVYDEMNTDD